MKLWHSFVKELLLASRSFYFYIELFMAGIFVFLLVFVIPDKFNAKAKEYIYLDLPEAVSSVMTQEYLNADMDGIAQETDIKLDDGIVPATLYETDTKKIFIVDTAESAKKIADETQAFAAVIRIDEQGKLTYTYYLQGYETQRLRNTYLVFHNEDSYKTEKVFNAQDVRTLKAGQVLLTDKENVIPSFLTFNGSLMGLFIIASYIFLDKKEGVIKAYAVTASSVWQYLLSNMGIIMVTGTLTSFIIVLPVMGLRLNYLLMIIFLLTTGFAASALGLVITSYYDDISRAFGALYVLIVALMLPNIAYFIPSWNPAWMKFIPTYVMLEGFKEILLPEGDTLYVLVASLWFVVAGLILFLFANVRFKKTLTV